MSEASGSLDLDALLPHRGRMRLVERALEWSDDEVLVAATLHAGWPLVAGERAETTGLLEFVAQSAAVLMGWRRRREEQQGGAGVLVGFRSATFERPWLPLGAELRCRARLLRSLQSYAAFSGEVEWRGQIVCRAELQAFRPEGVFEELLSSEGDRR